MDKLKWITAEYTIKELLKPGGGVVVQRDILERWKTDNPGQEVKAHAGFKCNQEDSTVSMRIAVADDTITTGIAAKIENKVPDPITDPSKLLQPGQDETLLENKNLKIENDKLILRLTEFAELQERYDRLIEKYQITGGKIIELHKSYGELKEASDEYIKALTDNRDALLVENDKWKKDYSRVCGINAKLRDEVTDLLVENKELKKQLKSAMDVVEQFDPSLANELNELNGSEDSADLTDAKEVIAKDDFIDADVSDGPYSESAPTLKELADAAIKVAESNITGKPLLALRKEIPLSEIEGDDLMPLPEMDGTDTNTFDIVVKVACDQTEVVGPDEDSSGEGDKDIT